MERRFIEGQRVRYNDDRSELYNREGEIVAFNLDEESGIVWVLFDGDEISHSTYESSLEAAD
jgi:hypothetical protein